MAETRTRLFTLALLACVPPVSLLADGGIYSSPVIDVLHYRISVECDGSDSSISARTELLLRSLTDALTEIRLDFSGLTVDSVTIDSETASFHRDPEILAISLPSTRQVNDTMICAVSYHGRPGAGLSLATTKFGDPSAFADNWPDLAHTWFPCVDHPSDKATVEFLITTQSRFDVVSNGLLEEVTTLPGERKRWHWRESAPIPTYSMVFGAAEFSVQFQGSVTCIPVSHYYYYRDRQSASGDYGQTLEILRFFSGMIGPYPYPKLAVIESSTRFGGMENAGTIFLNEHRIGEGQNLEALCAHEIAHQWFGNSVTPGDWPHLWLSEGFAEYFEKLYSEHIRGREAALQEMRTVQDAYLQFDRDGTARLIPVGPAHPRDLLNAVAYKKGASILHMLRFELGDSLFAAGMRAYYAAHKNGNAITADFQTHMESTAGHSLGTFFHQWTTFPGYPRFAVRPSWEENEKTLVVTIEQTQPGPLFSIPLELLAITDTGEYRSRLLVGSRTDVIRIQLPKRPDRILVDPDSWILKTVAVDDIR